MIHLQETTFKKLSCFFLYGWNVWKLLLYDFYSSSYWCSAKDKNIMWNKNHNNKILEPKKGNVKYNISSVNDWATFASSTFCCYIILHWRGWDFPYRHSLLLAIILQFLCHLHQERPKYSLQSISRKYDMLL